MCVTMTRDAASAVDGFDMTGGWPCCHYDWTNRNNYALVGISLAGGGSLRVRIIRAFDLCVKEGGMFGGKLHVIASNQEEEFRTEKAERSVNPVWDSNEAIFRVQQHDAYVSFKVFSADTLC